MPFYRAERPFIGDKNVDFKFHSIDRGTEVYCVRVSDKEHYVGYFVKDAWIEHPNVPPRSYTIVINRLWPIDTPSKLIQQKTEQLGIKEFTSFKEAKFLRYSSDSPPKSRSSFGDVKSFDGKKYLNVQIVGIPNPGDSGILFKPLEGELLFYSPL